MSINNKIIDKHTSLKEHYFEARYNRSEVFDMLNEARKYERDKIVSEIDELLLKIEGLEIEIKELTKEKSEMGDYIRQIKNYISRLR